MATIAETSAALKEISIHPPKRLLYGPGPGQVHPRVYQAMAQPIVGHLDAYFFEISANIQRLAANRVRDEERDHLRHLGHRQRRHGNGDQQLRRAGNEGCGLCQRILLRSHDGDGAPPGRGRRAPGKAVGRGFQRRRSQRIHPVARSPRSSCMCRRKRRQAPIQRGDAICKAAHEVGALVIADCVTSLGAMPVEVDKTGIDIAYSCSQKGLSCPPGLRRSRFHRARSSG